MPCAPHPQLSIQELMLHGVGMDPALSDSPSVSHVPSVQTLSQVGQGQGIGPRR